MRFNRKFIVFATCVIITTILFDSISNAAQLLKLERSWSSQDSKELVIGLKATDIREKENKIQADVILWNNTMTWVYVEQDFTQKKVGQVPVPTQGVYLLGPLYTKNLGTIEFSKDSFLQFNAKTAIGTSPGTRESNMLLGTIAIDLAMRGFFSKELPPNAFDRPLVFPIELGMVSIDPLFFTITSHCSGSLGALSRTMAMKDIDGALNALGRFLLCTTEASIREKMQEWLTKLFSKEMAEKWAKKFVGSIGDFLNLPMKATLMKILTEYTLNAPPESWVRIDAVETEEPVIKEWKEYKLGALSFSVPSDWKVIEREDSFAAGSTEDYTDRKYILFMVGVIDTFKDVEQGKVRIVHYGSSGGQMEESGTTSRTISITHMGHLVDSFKADIAGRSVTVCVLRLTEKEGMSVKGIEFTNYSFVLIEGGKHYAFTLIGADSAFQSVIFKQLVSKIRLSSQPTTKPVSSFLMPLEEGTYEKAQGFKGTVYKGLFHLGRDYCVKKAGENKDGCLYGTPVCPIGDGIVVDLRFNKYPVKDPEKWKKGDGVGNYVSIEHENGIIAVYMHLAKVEVIKGQKVTAQTPIGEAGDIILHPEVPGMCPHLHLEIRKNGVTTLHVPPNLRYGYVSQDGTTKIEEGKRIENVLEWIDSNFCDPDPILTPRKASPALEEGIYKSVSFNPATVEVKNIGGRWKIVDGSHWMFDFDENESEAREALAIIKKYGFDRSCFVGRPGATFKYLRK